MPAREALSLVILRNGESGAVQTIAKRCAARLIAARANLLVGAVRSARGKDMPFREDQAPVPANFWWANGEAALDQDWAAGDFGTWIDGAQWSAFGVEFLRTDIEQMLAPDRLDSKVAPADPMIDGSTSSPAALLPSDDEIRAKMIELCERGASRDFAAKIIREISGFESVQNEHARRLVSGLLPRGRRKKTRQDK